MKKFVPMEKMSKKAKREMAMVRRNTWGPISPVTRRTESKKIYNRKKVRMVKNDFYHTEPFYFTYKSRHMLQF